MTDQAERRIRALEDQAALKRLVDMFSNLADNKKVHEQTFLFTDDAIVQTYFGRPRCRRCMGAQRSRRAGHRSSPPLTPFII
jgi:hypothetical protein